ncbi:hypothetical protein J6590_087094 [Homalodisca vitripennis]|nr:hypothetical protein J6590_087094 [Homalodisca vitripennis]
MLLRKNSKSKRVPTWSYMELMKLDALLAEGISLYNDGHALTMTKLFSKAGISPGSNTVGTKRRTLIVFAFGKKETQKNTRSTGN